MLNFNGVTLRNTTPWNNAYRDVVPISTLVGLIAFAMAIEWISNLPRLIESNSFLLVGLLLTCLAISPILVFSYNKLAIRIFVVCGLGIAIGHWTVTANHIWLAIWFLLPLAFFPSKPESEDYCSYLRYSLSLVMFSAASQKLISGNYLDGSYLMYLAEHGSFTENFLMSLCGINSKNSCDLLIVASIISVVWQFFIAFFLALAWKSSIVLFLEFTFLLSVGIVADEMNFQVINIAAICIALRLNVNWLIVPSMGLLLFIDLFTLSTILEFIFGL